MNIVHPLQCIRPEVCFDCVRLSVASVDHHRRRQVLNVSNPFLCYSVLKLSIDTVVGDCLPTSSYVVDPNVLRKSPIVGMVVANSHSVGCASLCFELSFAFKSLLSFRYGTDGAT